MSWKDLEDLRIFKVLKILKELPISYVLFIEKFIILILRVLGPILLFKWVQNGSLVQTADGPQFWSNSFWS